MRKRERPDRMLCTGHRATRPEVKVCAQCDEEYAVQWVDKDNLCIKCVIENQEPE